MRLLLLIFMAVGWLTLPSGNVAGQDAAEEATEPPVIYTLVKITDIDETVTFDALIPEDLKTLTKTVNDEKVAMDKAYNNQKAKWKAKYAPKDKATTGKKPRVPAFPLKRPEPKKISQVGRFPTEAEALTKKKECEEREAARLLEIEKQKEKKEAERQRVIDRASTPMGFSAPKAPMAKPPGDDADDPELQKELFSQLKKEIEDVVAGVADSAPKEAGSKDGKKIVVKQGKRLGEGGTTPMSENPFAPLVDHPNEMVKQMVKPGK